MRWSYDGDNKYQDTYTTHAVYSSSYSEVTRYFETSNSWGEFLPNPRFHDTKIYAIDFVLIVLKEAQAWTVGPHGREQP